jgi:hypothetical protein
MPMRADAGTFAAEVGFVTQSQMKDPAFTRGHRVKPVWGVRLPDPLGDGECRNAQLLLAEQAVVVGVETEQGVFVGGHVQDFLRQLLQRQHRLALVGHQEANIGALEFDDEGGLLEVVSDFVAVQQVVGDVEVHGVKDNIEELLDFVADGIDGVFAPVAHGGRRWGSFRCHFFFFFDCAVVWTGAGAAMGWVLLKKYCCTMPTTLPVSQYNTRPLDAP